MCVRSLAPPSQLASCYRDYTFNARVSHRLRTNLRRHLFGEVVGAVRAGVGKHALKLKPAHPLVYLNHVVVA